MGCARVKSWAEDREDKTFAAGKKEAGLRSRQAVRECGLLMTSRLAYRDRQEDSYDVSAGAAEGHGQCSAARQVLRRWE